ncbi:hypothetical protein, partial [Shewanella sp.]|uniref:hypothetical protein n=1 Tax=Shewanella sp. TaxID=50422 RepID=UPI00405491B8
LVLALFLNNDSNRSSSLVIIMLTMTSWLVKLIDFSVILLKLQLHFAIFAQYNKGITKLPAAHLSVASS